jgi:apolipoprotein D and lipocalin family protein
MRRKHRESKPVNDPQEGRLKVSFFGPFYSAYNVIAINKDYNYKYVPVAGESTKYLWIISREKTIPEEVKQNYIQQERGIGYKTEEQIWVRHERD